MNLIDCGLRIIRVCVRVFFECEGGVGDLGGVMVEVGDCIEGFGCGMGGWEEDEVSGEGMSEKEFVDEVFVGS